MTEIGKIIIRWFVPCKHLFKADEMQPRDENGNVKWECCKCKKLFIAENGLSILENGTCDGRWDLPNKYMKSPIKYFPDGYDSDQIRERIKNDEMFKAK